MSSIVKKAFMFETFDSPEPVRIEEGNLISYEYYNDSNNIKITVHGPDGNITLDGPTLYLKDYVRDVEYNDLVHSKGYIFEQQKDRTYREGQKDNFIECDVDASDKANRNKRINTAAVLDYLKEKSNGTFIDKIVVDWIKFEIEKLEKDYSRLSILEASDEDIIQNALMEYGNQFRANYDSEVANKITDVRNRYLDRKDKE